LGEAGDGEGEGMKTLHVELNEELLELLDELAAKTSKPRGQVIRDALVLYKVALDELGNDTHVIVGGKRVTGL
jgi:predicted transcriptional regulator